MSGSPAPALILALLYRGVGIFDSGGLARLAALGTEWTAERPTLASDKEPRVDVSKATAISPLSKAGCCSRSGCN
jgi:hypothetical protein